MANGQDYADLGRAFDEVCQAPDQGVDGRRLDNQLREPDAE